MLVLEHNEYVSLWHYILRNYKKTTIYHIKYVNSPADDRDCEEYYSRHDINTLLINGSTKPLGEILKDIKDTLKPYKSWFHFKRDIIDSVFGIFYGIGNILYGLMTFVLCIPLFFYFLFASSLIVRENLHLPSMKCLSAWMFQSIFSIIKGITELASPLKILRIPLRSIITWRKGSPSYEKSPSFERAAIKGINAIQLSDMDRSKISSIYEAAMEINRKYEKALKKNRDVTMTPSLFLDKKKIQKSLTVRSRSIEKTGNPYRPFVRKKYYRTSLSEAEKKEYRDGFFNAYIYSTRHEEQRETNKPRGFFNRLRNSE